MSIKKSIGFGFKSLIDFRRWMGWKQIKGSTKNLASLAGDITTPDQPQHKESFAQAIKRLGLSEKEVEKKMVQHRRLAILYGVMTSILLMYSTYLGVTLRFGGCLLGLFVSVLSGTLTFREHFYYFQMRTHHLGSTFQDWFNFVRGKKKPTGRKLQ